MANNIIKRVWNQNKMVNIEDLSGFAFQAEDGGHTFEISGVDADGNAVALSGTVAGVFRRPDNADIALTGAASDGVASVTLTDDCYAVPGRAGLTIFVTEDSQKVAVYAAALTVARTSGGGVAGDTPQDVVDLINAIEAAVAEIPASYTDIMAAIAPTYSSSALYPVGAYAWYDGVLYRCTTAITTGETWTAAHWTAASIGPDVADVYRTVLEDVEIPASSLTRYPYWIKLNGEVSQSTSYSRARLPITKADKKIVLTAPSGSWLNLVLFSTTLSGAGDFSSYMLYSKQVSAGETFEYIITDLEVDGVTYDFSNTYYYISTKQNATAWASTPPQILIKRSLVASTDELADAEERIDTEIATLVGDACHKKLAPEAYEKVFSSVTIGEPLAFSDNASWRMKKFRPNPGTQYLFSLKATSTLSSEYVHVVAVDSSGIVLATYMKYTDTDNVTTTATLVFDDTVYEVYAMSRTIYPSNVSITENTSVSDEYVYGILDKLHFARTNDETSPHTLSFLFFSDIHGDVTSGKDITDFFTNYKAYFADLLNGGDVVLDVGTESITDLMATGLSSALNVIGNHDSSTIVNGSRNWDGMGLQGCYDKFIAPYYAGWGVTLGGAGVCYYYKDYSYGLRLVALDQSHWDATQKTWLANILADAKTNSKKVLILSHYLPESTTGKECNFTAYASPNAEYSYYTLGGGDAGAIVQDFIDGGGSFIMWIAGHSHRDRLGVCNTSTGVSVRQITKASPGRNHYEYREDKKNRSAFEIMTVDLDNNLVKFQRLGCNSDIWLTDKNGASYDVVNQKVIAQY